MSAPQFIFGGDTGVTPEQLKRNRAIMEALQARASTAPRNVGEGLSSLGQAILFRAQKNRVEKGEAAANEAQKGLWGAFGPASAGSGMSPTAAALNAPASPSSPFSDATSGPATAGGSSDAFLSSLIGTESGGRWDAKNDVTGAGGHKGHFGRLQFGQARLSEAAAAGVIPEGTSPQAFMASPEAQQAVEAWHFADIDAQAERRGLTRFIGQEVGGAPITQDAIRAMAHLGGIGGAQRYLESGGRHNPADAYGTSLRDYALKHGSASVSPGPVQVASLDPSAGVAQATGGMIATPQNGAIGDPESVRPYTGPGAQVDMPPQLGGTRPDPDEQRRRDGATAAKDIAVARALGVQRTSDPKNAAVAAALAPQGAPAPQPQGMSPVAAALAGPRAAPAPQPQQPLMQVAQAQPMQMPAMPQMPAYQGPDPQAMMGVLQNPWASDDQRQLAQYHLQQYGKHQQAAQTYALEAAQQQREWAREDQRYAVEDRREDTRLGLDQQRFQHERSQPINVGGVLVDPQTMQPVYQAPADPFTLNPGEIRFDGAGNRIAAGGEKPGFRQATPAEAESFGAAAGQFGPDGRFYAENPPSGMSVEIGPDGTRIVQGPGAGGGGGKVPTNFETDPNNPGGVRPIAGGPGEQLPAEFAGRIGISDSFLGQAPQLREQLLAGNVTGPWDRLQAGMNSSSGQAEVYRKLQSGADALQRLLTGAGMTENEAKVYAERYLPSYTDDADSAVTKLDQMVREIQNVRAASLRGRGGMGATVTPNGPVLGSPSNPIQLDEVVVPSGQNGGLPSDVTEEDIQHTMQVHGLTREQVLERLR